jgi:hypothetical protein
VPTLLIHPATDLTYASFVVQGFADRLGSAAIQYSTRGFPESYGGGRVLACRVEDDPDARVFCVFTDQTELNATGRAWARVYGMVNVDPAEATPDILTLGPTFGIRVSFREITRRHLAHMWRWAAEGAATKPRRHVRMRIAAQRTRALYKHTRQRTTIDAYVPRPSDADYVFFAAWPWAKHGDVNPPRARFIEACLRAPALSFEGGFAPRQRRDVPEVLGLSAPRRYSMREYLENVGRSAVAFNNPAVHGCLGWKLGEFLALGKAIISLPFERALPAPLEHGVHVHLVDGSPESLDDALARIRADHVYRRALEANARRWYDEHLAPARVAQRLWSRLERAPAE